MSSKNILRSIASLAALAMITSCGSSGGNSPNKVEVAPTLTMSDVDQRLLVSGGTYDQFQVVNIDPKLMTITFSIPLPSAPITKAQFDVTVPQIPGGTITVAPNSLGIWVASLTMPLKDLFSGITYQNPATLPSGKPLPGQLGNMPMLELTVFTSFNDPALHFYLYGSPQAIAIFYPLQNYNTNLTVVFQVTNKANSTLGYLGLLAPVQTQEQTFPGGVFGAYLIPWQLQQIITGGHNNLQ